MNGFDTLPIHGEGRAFYEKSADFRWVDGEVLITVKATPQPSSKYGDTVCVAGIRMSSTGPEWVRLYPVPFRSLYETQQFQKYDVLRLRMKPSDKDFRAESFNPDLLSIKKIGHLKPWKQRHPWISPLTDRWTMCEILEKARAEGYKSYPSLAVIRPKDIGNLTIEKGEDWTPEQKKKLAKDIDQGALFGDEKPQRQLQPPRYKAKYQYRCYSQTCSGHHQSLIDWELTEFVRRHHQADPDAVARKSIHKRFFEEMASPSRKPLFFVGNLLASPLAFNVLGVYRSVSN